MGNNKKIIIGTRQSKLALKQTDIVIEKLKQKFPALEIEIKAITTKGDKLTEGALRDIYGSEGKVAFTIELQEKLLTREFDIIVHSMKDAAANHNTPNIIWGAYIERESPWDMLLTKNSNYKTISDLPSGANIGTVSLRRKAAILKENPSLNVQNLRGTVQTRINKLRTEFDAIIMAEAAINRSADDLDLTNIFKNKIDRAVMLPAVGQGTIAIECRKNDKEIIDILSAINHQPTFFITECERAFLNELNGNCFSAISGLAEIKGNEIHFEGRIASEDGIYLFSITQSDRTENYKELGENAALKLKEDILQKKGQKFLQEILNIG